MYLYSYLYTVREDNMIWEELQGEKKKKIFVLMDKWILIPVRNTDFDVFISLFL